MAIDFPSSPTNGDVFTVGANSWTWDAAKSVWYASTPVLPVAGIDILIDGVLIEGSAPGIEFAGSDFATSINSDGSVNITTKAKATAIAAGDTTIVFQTNITDFKDSVQAASTANVTISNPGTAVFDGETLTAGQRLLLKNQTLAAANGIYDFNGSSSALTRSTDADAGDEVTGGMLVFCESGTENGNKLFVLSTNDPIVLGTTALTFDSIALPSNPEVVKSVKTTTYTLLTTDPNKWLACSNANPQAITVPGPSTKIPVGSVIWGKKEGVGNLIFAPGSGATIDSPLGLTLTKTHATFRLKKIANNRWSLTFYGENNLTTGYTATAYDAGTKSSGTLTPDPANGNLQRAVNGGAHTLAPPSVGKGDALTMVIQYTNNGSAGTITTSGFTIVDGDALTTTNNDDFFFFITVINGFSSLTVKALQ